MFPKLRFLGNGVAIEVECAALTQLRHQLAAQWYDWLSPQDRQSYRPHVTIQNKVDAIEAQQLFHELSKNWSYSTGYGEGLLLWHYQGGPWQKANEFLFGNLS